VLTIAACLPEADMRIITLAIVCSLPLAYFGAWLEQLYRKRQNLSYNAVISWNRRHPVHSMTPQTLTRRALAELFLLYSGLFLLCVLPPLLILKTVGFWLGAGFQPTWPFLWAAACTGAILSLRIHKAQITAGLALLLGILMGI